jgi:hypothetical protein
MKRLQLLLQENLKIIAKLFAAKCVLASVTAAALDDAISSLPPVLFDRASFPQNCSTLR